MNWQNKLTWVIQAVLNREHDVEFYEVIIIDDYKFIVKYDDKIVYTTEHAYEIASHWKQAAAQCVDRITTQLLLDAFKELE